MTKSNKVCIIKYVLINITYTNGNKMIATVAERGQVTIPKSLRISLGITPKTKLNFKEKDGKLIAEKFFGNDPVHKVMGCLKTKKSSDEIMKTLRGNNK